MISILVIQHLPALSSQATELLTERAYSPSEVGRGLMDAGFVIQGVHDARTLFPATRDSKRLLVVARRPVRRNRDWEGGANLDEQEEMRLGETAAG